MNTPKNNQNRASMTELVRAYIEVLVSSHTRGDSAAGGAFARGMVLCPVEVRPRVRPVPDRVARTGRLSVR